MEGIPVLFSLEDFVQTFGSASLITFNQIIFFVTKAVKKMNSREVIFGKI